MTGRKIVTEWFRTARIWPVIADLLAALGRPVVVWSGACGTGEEPYSVAMLLIEHGIAGRVLATDLDPGLIARAERGIYRPKAIRQARADCALDAARIIAHFRPPAADGRRRLRPAVRERVTFATLDLARDPAPACDVALTRNVWRHLTPAGQEHLAAQLAVALHPAGRLVLGGGDLLDADLDDTTPPALAARFEPAEHSMLWRHRPRDRR